jgi:hypothetical protein
VRVRRDQPVVQALGGEARERDGGHERERQHKRVQDALQWHTGRASNT